MAATTNLPAVESRETIASTWHTVVLLLVVAALSVVSSFSHGPSPIGFGHGKVGGYLSVMVAQWLIILFIWWGIRGRGLSLRDLAAGPWNRWTGPLRDLGIAIAFLIISAGVLAAASHLLHANSGDLAARLAPHTAPEIVAYLALCATAGFCEEIIFRGYLQRQLTAWTGSATGGLLMQAIAFGAAHGYQGARLMTVITVFGCLFGLLARWRRSLRPGMMAHFLQDALITVVKTLIG